MKRETDNVCSQSAVGRECGEFFSTHHARQRGQMQGGEAGAGLEERDTGKE